MEKLEPTITYFECKKRYDDLLMDIEEMLREVGDTNRKSIIADLYYRHHVDEWLCLEMAKTLARGK